MIRRAEGQKVFATLYGLTLKNKRRFGIINNKKEIEFVWQVIL